MKNFYLEHSDEVDIISVNHFINKVNQFFDESLVLLEPRSMEMKTQRSSVGFEMPIEIVAQKSGKLIGSQNVGARGNQVATRQALVKVRIVTTIQFINNHFPNRMAS